MNLRKVFSTLLSGAVLFSSPGFGCDQAAAAENASEAGGVERLGRDQMSLRAESSETGPEQQFQAETAIETGREAVGPEAILPFSESEGPAFSASDAASETRLLDADESRAAVGAIAPAAVLAKKTAVKSGIARSSRALDEARQWVVPASHPQPADFSDHLQLASLAGIKSHRQDQLALNQSLGDALVDGDSARVLSLLAHGADAKAPDQYGRTPLMKAAASGDQKTIGILLDYGAAVNDKDSDGRTAFMDAATYGYLDAVKLLWKRGADVNATENDGATAVIMAVSEGQLKVLKFLLGHGGDVNATSDCGYSALDWAIINGRLKEAKVLLDHGIGGRFKAFFAAIGNSQPAIARTIFTKSLKRFFLRPTQRRAAAERTGQPSASSPARSSRESDLRDTDLPQLAAWRKMGQRGEALPVSLGMVSLSSWSGSIAAAHPRVSVAGLIAIGAALGGFFFGKIGARIGRTLSKSKNSTAESGGFLAGAVVGAVFGGAAGAWLGIYLALGGSD